MWEIKAIVARVISGDASDVDRQILIQWLQMSDHYVRDYTQYEAIWRATEIIANKSNFDSQQAFNDFQRNISRIKRRDHRAYKRHIAYRWRVTAIMILPIIIAGCLYFFISKNNISEKIISYQEVQTTKGSKTKLTLADGTQVWLNCDSKLQYPETFAKDKREVYLVGEGYFKVSKDVERPFFVRTGDLKIKVVGTSFNVRSYPEEQNIITTVVTGCVSVSAVKKNREDDIVPTILNPNEQLVYDKVMGKKNHIIQQEKDDGHNDSTHNYVAEIVAPVKDSYVYVAWKDNKMIFENNTFDYIARQLELRYNVRIIFVQDELKQYRFTGSFDEIGIEQVMSVLQYASPFYYSINKEVITISTKPIKK